MTAPDSILSFENPVILLGGGAYDGALVKHYLAQGLELIAADGGANNVEQLGVIPRAIIGDMDSLKTRAHWEQVSKVIEFSEQDTTDFEKCLYATAAPYYLAFGFTGDQFDHTLAALHVLTRYGTRRKILLVDAVDVIFATRERFEMAMEPGERVSIYPLGPVSFKRSQGLAYPLDGVHLEQGRQIGTSNQAVARDIVIEPVPGNATPYAVIVPLAHLDGLIAAIA